MACELKKAIELLMSTPATKKMVTNILNNDKSTEKLFGELVKRVTGDSIDTASATAFSSKLGDEIRDVTGVSITEDTDYALKQLRSGLGIYSSGEFNPAINNIIIGAKPSRTQVGNFIAQEFYDNIIKDSGVDVANSKALDGSIAVEAVPEADAVFKIIKDARGTTTLLHELVHAGTVEYMDNHPQSVEVARIDDIFDYLHGNYKDLGITKGYWMKSTNEFISEALSNPEFMQELINVVPSKPVSRLTDMYSVLLNSLLQMLGFKGKELNNLFDILLDSNLKILEGYSKTVTPVKKETTIDKVTLKAELADISNDIRWLEEAKETETLKERIVTNREIDKLMSKADKVQEKLGLEGTVGDRILSNEASKKKKGKLIKGETETRLSDIFEVKKVYNSLNDSAEIFDREPIEGVDPKFMDAAKKLTNITKKYINSFIKNGLDQSGIADIDVKDTANVEVFQSLTRLLLVGEPGSYTLPDEVTTAMALAINDWMVTFGSTERTAEFINELLGRQSDTKVTDEDRARVEGIDGFTSTAANSIGNIIYKNLGLKIKQVEGANREVTEAKFKTELGLTALAAMQSNNMINTIVRDSNSIFDDGSMLKIGTLKLTGAKTWLESPVKSKMLSIGSKYANKALGTVTSMRYPSTKAPLRERTVRNASEIGKHYEVAKITVDAVNMQENTSWSWTEDYMSMYKGLTSTIADTNKFKKLMGWKDPKDVHVELQASINGKNFAIERDMEFLEEWYNDMSVSGDTEMYFPYKFVKNGRFILDTNTFNPQGKKLHRFAVNIRSAIITKENTDDHDMALAMAFGIDIDKMSKKSALAEWKALKSKLDKMLADGMSDIDILTEAIDNKWSHDFEHTIAGLAELKTANEYTTATGSIVGFESKLPVETDAVTSGFILKILQMPIIDDADTFLAKGGVFTSFDKDTSFGKQAEQPGFLDAYNTPAKVMVGKIPDVTKELLASFPENGKTAFILANKRATELALGIGTEGLVDISRSFMKNPFMTFNYGEGLSGIINTISDSAIESMYDKMAGDTKDIKEVFLLLQSGKVGMKRTNEGWKADAINKATMQLAKAEALKFKGLTKDERLKYKIPAAIEANIRSNIASGVGVALDRTFTDTYGKYIDAASTINNSFTAMFRLFKVKLDAAMEAKHEELGRHLTDAETTEIISTMEESLPAIKTALGDAKSKMMIFKTEATNYELLDNMKESGQANVRLKNKGRLSGQAKMYTMVESFASGAVVPIHFIDGSIQSIVLSKIEALGVHDANLFYADNVVEGTRLYNEGTAQVSSEYSLATEVLSSLAESMNAASQSEIDMVNEIYISEAKDPDNAIKVGGIYSDMKDLQVESEDAREKLYSAPIRFEHAAYEGAHYDFNTNGDTYKRMEPSVELKVKEDIAEVPVDNDPATTLIMYHGTNKLLSELLDNDGNLVLKPSDNFTGKTTSVSFTHSKDTSMRYAAMIKGGGPQGYDFSKAYTIKIKAGVLKNLQRESAEEFAINTDKPVVIPKEAFEIVPHRLSKLVAELEAEYPLAEYTNDNYSDYEQQYLSESEKISSYIDGYIAEEDGYLADEMYKEMEYLTSGGYKDLEIKSETDIEYKSAIDKDYGTISSLKNKAISEGSTIFTYHLSPGDTLRSDNPFKTHKYYKYSKAYSSKIMEVIAPKIITDSEFVTRQFTEGFMKEIVLGEYKPGDNTVFLADFVENDVEMVLKAHYSKDLVADSSKKERADAAEIADGNYNIIKEYINSADAEHTRFHELVHAGSVAYMLANPESKLTKRIDDLYVEVMLAVYPPMDTYWATSREEFLAEGMSNPEVIKMLMGIKPAKPEKYFMNAFDVLISTVLSMLGVKGERKGTMHDYLVDSFTAMLVEQEAIKAEDTKAIENAKGKKPKHKLDVKLLQAARKLPVVSTSGESDKALAIKAGDALRETVKDIFVEGVRSSSIAAEVVKTTNHIKKNCK